MVDLKSKIDKIPYIDFTREYKDLKEHYDQACSRVLENGHYILGPEVLEFEKQFANYCNTKFAVGVGSGIDALILVLDAWGIGPGDEIIVAANTYIATAFAGSRLGAKPVLVDIDEETFNIDVDQLESAITDKTRAILPTHLYGQLANMNEIVAIAKKHNLKVLEDAAQAHGAVQNSKICGGHSDAVAFSFYPTKNLGAFGDGGAITTNDAELYDKLLHLRNNGSKTKFYYDYIGYNSRLDELQAAFLKIKLKYLDSWNNKRQNLAELYNSELASINEIKLPEVLEINKSVWHVYCIRVLNDKRDKLQEYLNERGIGTNIHYPEPIHLQNCYKNLEHKPGDFPRAELACKEILSLPLSPYHSEEEILKTTLEIKNFFN